MRFYTGDFTPGAVVGAVHGLWPVRELPSIHPIKDDDLKESLP